MPTDDELVSIIIPAYNAELFLKETISSVYAQTFKNWEIIVVDDGSADQTHQLVSENPDPRVKLIRQANQGVSAARNNGLRAAAGEYIIFLDADDLLMPRFIEARLSLLRENTEFGFAGGWVETFPEASPLRKAVANDPEQEILFFDSSSVTIPSNYLLRKNILLNHHLAFNTRLSSTADRFFILQISKLTKGKVTEDAEARLLYRITPGSMSHSVSPALLHDNERFYDELKKNGLMPSHDKARFKCLYFFSLALGFLKIKYAGKFILYMSRSFFSHPALFFRRLFQRALMERK